jgi:hypothetical protein
LRQAGKNDISNMQLRIHHPGVLFTQKEKQNHARGSTDYPGHFGVRRLAAAF